MKTKWTAEQARDFRDWHDQRLGECGYPPDVVAKLIEAREKFIPPVEVPHG